MRGFLFLFFIFFLELAMKFRLAATTTFVALTFAPAVYALEMTNEMYVVGTLGRSNIGYSAMQVDNNAIYSSSFPVSGVSFNSAQEQDARLAGKLQLGYQFSPNWSVEGGYVNLGKTTYAARNAAQTVTTYKKNLWGQTVVDKRTSIAANSTLREYKVTGWNIVGVGAYPVSDSFSLIGKVGMLRAEVKASTTGKVIGGGDQTWTKWVPTYGVGGDYKLNEEFGLRAEVERFNNFGDDTNTGAASATVFSLGMTGRF